MYFYYAAAPADCVCACVSVQRPEEETRVAMETQGRAAPPLAEDARHAFCMAERGGAQRTLPVGGGGRRCGGRGDVCCWVSVVRRRERLKSLGCGGVELDLRRRGGAAGRLDVITAALTLKSASQYPSVLKTLPTDDLFCCPFCISPPAVMHIGFFSK